MLVVMVPLILVVGCTKGQKTEPGAAVTQPADGALPPPPGPNTVVAFTWFEQGSTVPAEWAKARDAMKGVAGFRYWAVFTALDERQSNAMVVSIWDDSSAAKGGLQAAAAQVPAGGWAKTGLFRRAAADGKLGDEVLSSVVVVIPITSQVDSARAVTDFIVANGFMRTQPGYLASSLFKCVAGDPGYGYLIAGRWKSRENLQQVAALPAFQEMQTKLAIAGQPTTYQQQK